MHSEEESNSQYLEIEDKRMPSEVELLSNVSNEPSSLDISVHSLEQQFLWKPAHSHVTHDPHNNFSLTNESFLSDHLPHPATSPLLLTIFTQRSQLKFKNETLSPDFTKPLLDLVKTYASTPHQLAFAAILQFLQNFQDPIFAPKDSPPCIPQDPVNCSCISCIFQTLFLWEAHAYLIYSFDLFLCHFGFVCVALKYWCKIFSLPDYFNSQSSPLRLSTFTDSETFLSDKNSQASSKGSHSTRRSLSRNLSLNSSPLLYPQRKSYQENLVLSEKDSKLKKHEECWLRTITRYITDRSQDINDSKPAKLVLAGFLRYLRQIDEDHPLLQQETLLLYELGLYGLLHTKLKDFPCRTRVALDSQMYKYEYEDKLIQDLDKSYEIFHLISLIHSACTPLGQYYGLPPYQKAKQQYQKQKDTICIWLFELVVRICEKKTNESVYRAGLYVISFFGLLKKFSEARDIESLSTFVIALENIKQHLPNLWAHAIENRPEINQNLKIYTRMILKKVHKPEQLFYPRVSPIVWEECLYDAVKVAFSNDSQDLREKHPLQKHQIFYKEFLRHIIDYRNANLRELGRYLEEKPEKKEIGVWLNIYLFDFFLYSVHEWPDTKLKLDSVITRAKMANLFIKQSFLDQYFDYYFLGSKLKYSQIDI